MPPATSENGKAQLIKFFIAKFFEVAALAISKNNNNNNNNNNKFTFIMRMFHLVYVHMRITINTDYT